MRNQKNRPKILIVDDEPFYITIMGELLVDNGYEVITAANGKQAQIMAEDALPDLILLDILMPDMDGYDTCLILKSRSSTRGIPVIFVTSKTEEIDEAKGFECGAVDYIRKPIAASTMLARVETHLQIVGARKQIQELLSETLLGSIQVLNDILVLVDPAFHRMLPRLKRYVKGISDYLDLPDKWLLEIAAMLSHIGCAIIPAETIKRINSGESVSEDEQQMYDMHPSIAQDLISKIPRLESVAKMIGSQRDNLDKEYLKKPLSQWDTDVLGGHLLKVVITYDRLAASGLSAEEVIAKMQTEKGRYSPHILEALETVAIIDQKGDVQLLLFEELQEGHVLKEDLYTRSGALIIQNGKEITKNTLTLLQPFAERQGIKEPIRVKRSVSALDSGIIGIQI